MCVCPAFAGATKQLYSMVNTKISFLLSSLHFQLTDFSKSTSFTSYGVIANLFRSANLFRRNLFASGFVPDFQKISEFVPDGQRSMIL